MIVRKIRIASAKNPYNDFIELNDFNGFLCTQFQTLGISRSIEFLEIKNRSIPVDNKTAFKKYNLVIEILTKYRDYEAKYYELISFLDRNKKDGIRLYYKPYDNIEERYCLCSVESSSKTQKMQPIVLMLTQNSLWLGEKQTVHSSPHNEEEGNLFVFSADAVIPPVYINGKETPYYRASFELDETVTQDDYYCVAFYNGINQEAEIKISGYNEVPLSIIIKGYCVNPEIVLHNKRENKVIKKVEVIAEIGEGYYLEINSNIIDNGVWRVNGTTGAKTDLTDLVNYANGSPFIYLDNGEYYITVTDSGGNQCVTDISWNEEYSE